MLLKDKVKKKLVKQEVLLNYSSIIKNYTDT